MPAHKGVIVKKSWKNQNKTFLEKNIVERKNEHI
jgi:hypothetical protein